MCGILGVYRKPTSHISLSESQQILEKLMIASQSRGQDSSGVLSIDNGTISVAKHSCAAISLVKSAPYSQIINASSDPFFFAMGHSRMETNGSFLEPHNNQPILKDSICTIHNGIIVNTDDLWNQFPDLNRDFQVDTEFVCSYVRHQLKENISLSDTVKSLFSLIEGNFNLGILAHELNGLLLTTNSGSLYYLTNEKECFFAFASELLYFQKLFESMPSLKEANFRINHLKPGEYLWFDFETGTFQLSDIEKGEAIEARATPSPREVRLLDTSKLASSVPPPRVDNFNRFKELEKVVTQGFERARERIKELRRCTRCTLPETMPFIKFDNEGVCNYCHRHQPRETRGLDELNKAIEKYVKLKGPNCIVSFSGGRDSSYALHYVVKELGLKPLAFSYDWGMLTDLGRRNQSRMTGKLGVEHILVSADIQAKRRNIRYNVLAWLKRPRLGLVPLFMAGDKQYFYHLNRVRQSTGVELVMYADNSLEKTDFKYGFANVELTPEVGKAYAIGKLNSLKLLWYYGKEYLLNPRYINPSLIDTFGAYLSSYFVEKDYTYLFRYILWDEKTVEDTLVNEYNWELAPDTHSSWRIGDGTQAFYNYIYYLGSGLTENDTFRSNQIREGVIERDKALQLSEIGNQPRIDSLAWYFDTIGVDGVEAIKRVNEMPKRYTF